MYPGTSGFGSLPAAGGGQMAPMVKRQPGVRVPIEGASDWALRHITYEGTERYVKPPEYQDELLERALLIDWRQVLGSELEYTNDLHEGGNFVLTETDPIEIEQDAPVPVEQQTIPDAGPWHGVAKNLHESLLQMNVFLDNLNVLRQTGYMAALTILDPNQSDPQPDLPNHNRAAQWVWKRKALTDASNVLEMSIRRMDQSGIETRDDQELKDRTQFFHELRKMREYWRIRKIGDHITGDLGYKIFGSKYSPREVFDISRRAKPEIYLNSDRSRVDPSEMVNETLCQSILQVTVPRDLARRATLTVTILPDDKTTTNLFTELDDGLFEYMRLDTKKQEQIHWDNALKWAQETLICRATYKTLCKDAATSHLRRTLIKGDVLVTHLCDDLLIRFELKYFPFKELKELVPDGDAYLNRVLRTIIVAEQCVRSCRPQVFVSLPLTPLIEQLDFRGPKAFSEKEIEDRRPHPVRYLSKICTVATHYTLVKMAINTLKEFMATESDPGLTFRFLRCAQTYTIIMCTLTSKYCEHPSSKSHFHIRISEDDVVVQMLPTYDIKCHRTREDLRWGIRQLVVAHSVSAAISIAKNSWMFQLTHANMNNVDQNGNPAPTVYLYNEGTSRAIYLKFFMDKTPEIYVKKLTSTVDHSIPFTQINYNRLQGPSLVKKLDSLYSLFRESDCCDAVDV